MKIIGIRFADNDFYFTIRAFLTIIWTGGIERYDHLDKEGFAELFNLSATGLYWLAQNRHRFEGDRFATGDCFATDDFTQAGMAKYLTIGPENIYFDDEVKEYIKSQGSNVNGEFHFLDTQVHTPYIYTV